jgi:EAL domain-containing protein (putative c-di-GMP-specific phosphodiesterase class I)/CheY-like chemotaxis protein
MKILLIDDEPFVLNLLARQLANLGCKEVIACERAPDALTQLGHDAEAVDLIFCDLQMPEMDGVEFIHQLVHVGYAGALVLVTGEDERILLTAEKLAQAHKLNVAGALSKPVSPVQLQRVLESHASSTPALPGRVRKTYEPGELRRAIANGELVNHYQPKVEMKSGSVMGAETLVRWQHPQDGLVFPDQFIRMAEEHGMIDDLTRAVLSAALGQMRQWQNAGLNVQVAVNVSMDNLTALDFPDFVADSASAAGIHLSNLMLEVTESRLMKDPLKSLEILTRLRLKNIGLSIDDFGTGHSSLAQLRDIPFNELKVDRGFVHGAYMDSSLKAIVEASCNLARSMGMKIVAEGIEDRADWNLLHMLGCDLAQGYFISRPMPASGLAQWIADWETRYHEFQA